MKKKKHVRSIKDIVVLIGQDSENAIVYSDALSWHEYYDGEHLWDEKAQRAKAHLSKLRACLALEVRYKMLLCKEMATTPT